MSRPQPGFQIGQEILKSLLKLNQDLGTTVILVTHDAAIGEQAQRTIHIRDGLVVIRQEDREPGTDCAGGA
jgi:ABC-type lipoprotein export system ATPase subunit